MANLVAGPELHHTTDTTVEVWFALDGVDTVSLYVDGVLKGSKTTQAASGYFDYVEATVLSANTEYSYDLRIGGSIVAGPHTFRTMPVEGSPARFNFLVFQDTHNNTRRFTYVPEFVITLRDASPDKGLPIFAQHVGDFQYESSLTWSIANARANYIARREDVAFNASYRQLFRTIPMYHTWDDWDSFGDNKCGAQYLEADIQERLQVWQEGMAGHPPLYNSTDGNYYQYAVADCSFISIDERSRRDICPATQPFTDLSPWDPDLEFMSSTQLEWLKDAIWDARGQAFTFLFLGGTWTDHVTDPPYDVLGQRDSVGIYFRKQRNELMQFLKDNPACAHNLIAFDGDDHENIVRIPTHWREPWAPDYPSTGGGRGYLSPHTKTDVEVADVPLITIKAGMRGAAGILGYPFRYMDFKEYPVISPDYSAITPGDYDIADIAIPEMTYLYLTVDTTKDPPELHGKIVGAGFYPRPTLFEKTDYTNQVIYRFGGPRGSIWFPKPRAEFERVVGSYS